MSMHMQVCMGGRGGGVLPGYVGVGCSLGYGMSMLPIKGESFGCERAVEVPCCWEHGPSLQRGHCGWAAAPPALQVCLCPKAVLP